MFAVFDGHGGPEVARFCQNHIVPDLLADPDFKKKDYKKALTNIFLKFDKMILEEDGIEELKSYSAKYQIQPPDEVTYGNAHNSGCTANVVLMTQTHIYCASAGDARSVLYERG